MISDIDKYVDFLCQHKLSEAQFLILWLVHTKDEKNIRKYKEARGFNIHDIEYLIDIRFIDDFGLVKDNREYNIYDFIITDKFTKIVVIDEEDAYNELVKVYPKWIEVKGTKYPSIKGDPMILERDYGKAHKKNKLAHQRIIDITTRFFKGAKTINSTQPIFTGNLHDYILNRRWNLLEEDLQKGVGLDVFKSL